MMELHGQRLTPWAAPAV